MHSHLEGFPEGAIEAFQGRIQGFNHAAQSQFPELAVGEKLPPFLTDTIDGPEGAGSITPNRVRYMFSRISGCRRELLLFRPASQAALTDRQLDGFIRQMRGFLQEILMEVEAVSNGAPSGLWAFYKSFCRTYRLLSNLEFVHSMGSGEGVLFRPTTLDLAGLCRSLTREAGDLLGEAGVKLRFVCPAASLLIPGDPALLQRLTQRFMQQNQVDPQDVEDFTKEYFNVICGRVVSQLFQTAHIRSRFCIPRFCRGRYVPAGEGTCRCVLNYVSNCKEGVQLIHQTLPVSS